MPADRPRRQRWPRRGLGCGLRGGGEVEVRQDLSHDALGPAVAATAQDPGTQRLVGRPRGLVGAPGLDVGHAVDGVARQEQGLDDVAGDDVAGLVGPRCLARPDAHQAPHRQDLAAGPPAHGHAGAALAEDVRLVVPVDPPIGPAVAPGSPRVGCWAQGVPLGPNTS